MTRVAIPAATTLLVVVIFIALAGYNRSDEPVARITLTERELYLARTPGENADRDPGMELHVAWVSRAEPLEARNWLTDDRLRSIGFNLSVLPSAPEAEDTYRRALPRVAWVAFEYDGPAWREIERQRQLREPLPGALSERSYEPSRLVPVDVAPDLEPLAERYPQGHVFLRASIGLYYLDPQQKGPLVYGSIRRLIPSSVHVPAEYRELVASLPRERGAARYEVDLAVGRLGIPYVTGMRAR